jgi:hypothetical protein
LDHNASGKVAPGRIREVGRIARQQAREEAHVVGVIGDDEEV